MGMNEEYERRMKEEQEIHEQVKSELEEYNKYIAGLMMKKKLTKEEERDLKEYHEELMKGQFTIVGGF